jgi:hypothetical protein
MRAFGFPCRVVTPVVLTESKLTILFDTEYVNPEGYENGHYAQSVIRFAY